MNIHMSGCDVPVDFDEKELTERMKPWIENYINVYVLDSYKKHPMGKPEIKFTVDKKGDFFFVLCFDTTEAGLRFGGPDYQERVVIAISANKIGTGLINVGSINGSVDKNERKIFTLDVLNSEEKGNYEDLGIGRTLIFTFEELAEKIYPDVNYTKLDCLVDKKDKNQNFYSKLGFYKTGEQKGVSFPMAKGTQEKVQDCMTSDAPLVKYYKMRAKAGYVFRFNNTSWTEMHAWNKICKKLQNYTDIVFEERLKLLDHVPNSTFKK